MARRQQYCEPCEFRGRKTKATTGYVSVFSKEKTHCCAKCLDEYNKFKAEMLPERERGAA